MYLLNRSDPDRWCAAAAEAAWPDRSIEVDCWTRWETTLQQMATTG